MSTGEKNLTGDIFTCYRKARHALVKKKNLGKIPKLLAQVPSDLADNMEVQNGTVID